MLGQLGKRPNVSVLRAKASGDASCGGLGNHTSPHPTIPHRELGSSQSKIHVPAIPMQGQPNPCFRPGSDRVGGDDLPVIRFDGHGVPFLRKCVTLHVPGGLSLAERLHDTHDIPKENPERTAPIGSRALFGVPFRSRFASLRHSASRRPGIVRSRCLGSPPRSSRAWPALRHLRRQRRRRLFLATTTDSQVARADLPSS